MKKVYVIGCVICLLLISLVSSTLYDTIFSPEESKKNVTFITSGTNSSFYFDINYPTELNKGTFIFGVIYMKTFVNKIMLLIILMVVD